MFFIVNSRNFVIWVWKGLLLFILLRDYNLKVVCVKIYLLFFLFFILMFLKKCIIELYNSSIEILDINVLGSLLNRLK